MNVFASSCTEVVDVEGGSITIRKLSAKSLRKASEAQQLAVRGAMREMGPDMMRLVNEASNAQAVSSPKDAKPTREERQAARYGAYDPEFVLNAGIQSWTFDGVKVNPDSVGDLDAVTSELLFKRIVDLSCGPLTEEDAKAAEGKL